MRPLDGDLRVLGSHRLLALVAQGGMGRVLLATGPDGLVAIKVVRPELLDVDGFRERFAREIEAAGGVTGPHVAEVLDADPDAEVPWLATEFVLGPSLQDALAAGPLDVESVLRLAEGLTRALMEVHSARLVHRDLKPANIMLAEDGPKVVDFGIARALEDHGTRLTHTGMLIGAPAFMSPEQAESGDVGQPSDVFSLGTVLVTAATGVNPFEGRGVPQTLYNLVHTTPDLSALPARVRAIAGPCLAKDPAERPTPARLLRMIGPRPAWPWPAAVADLAARQRVEIARYLGGDTSIWPDGPTEVLDPPRPRKPAPPRMPRPPRTPFFGGRRREWLRSAWLPAVILAVLVIAGGVLPALADDDDTPTAKPTKTTTTTQRPADRPWTPQTKKTPSPTPTRNDIKEAETGDCFENEGTEDHFDLVRATCDDGMFKVTAVLRGTTDTGRCPRPGWSSTYSAYDMVLCLRYQHRYGGSAYNTEAGGCVYGPDGSNVRWSASDCVVGAFTVLQRITGPSSHDDCDQDPLQLDESRSFTVEGAAYLNVRLCLSMRSPGGLLHVRKNNCLSVTGSGTSVKGEVAYCDQANAYVTGRTSRYNDRDFCAGHGWFTWKHTEHTAYSYTICWRYR